MAITKKTIAKAIRHWENRLAESAGTFESEEDQKKEAAEKQAEEEQAEIDAGEDSGSDDEDGSDDFDSAGGGDSDIDGEKFSPDADFD